MRAVTTAPAMARMIATARAMPTMAAAVLPDASAPAATITISEMVESTAETTGTNAAVALLTLRRRSAW